MPRSYPQARKAAELSNPLHRNLAAYALAAGAAGVSMLALAEPTEAQIVYTPAHEMIGKNEKMLIDLNHDGRTDVVIREIPCTQGTFFYANSLQAVPQRAGGGIKLGLATEYAKAMAFGARIGASQSFFTGQAMMMQVSSYGGYYYGSWSPFTKGLYLGIRFVIDGEVHYGWARMSTAINGRQREVVGLLTGYAYETQANEPIHAGDTGQGNADEEPPLQMKISPKSGQERSSTLGALALGASAPSHRCGWQDQAKAR
jgi:hypothetical protein